MNAWYAPELKCLNQGTMHHTATIPQAHLSTWLKTKSWSYSMFFFVEICLVCICAYSSIHLRSRRPQLELCIGWVRSDAHPPASRSKSPVRGLPVFILFSEWVYFNNAKHRSFSDTAWVIELKWPVSTKMGILISAPWPMCVVLFLFLKMKWLKLLKKTFSIKRHNVVPASRDQAQICSDLFYFCPRQPFLFGWTRSSFQRKGRKVPKAIKV